jgi:hypothetical protein
VQIDSFVKRVFDLARDKFDIESRRSGMSICFNRRSNKWLNENHLRDLFPEALEPTLTDGQINQLIESVAPGRPCTHVGMRTILRKIHSELAGNR